MVDSRQKGATAETKVRDELRKLTKLKWERVPGSGALDAKHGLKGDLYIPGEKCLYCVEVKHYASDHFNTTLFTSKDSQFMQFWKQTIRESGQVDKKPLLIFKHDRSKLFCAFLDFPTCDYRHVYVSVDGHEFYVALLDDWVRNEAPKFIA